MNETIIIVGYVAGAAGALAGVQPKGSVVWVEEPDVIRKRDARADLESSPYVREVVGAETWPPGAADAFYLTHPDLDPAAVIPLTEYSTPFAARLAERYGVPGGGFGAVSILRNKDVLRRVTAAAGVPNPESVAVASPDEVRAFMRDIGGPVVLKPANRQAAVGTWIIGDEAEVEAAWDACTAPDEFERVPDRPLELRMLAERYVDGVEWSCEMLVRDGVDVWTNITGKLLFPGPRPVESGHVVPAHIDDATATALADSTRRVIAAVGFGTGIVHCEWIVADGVPWLVECAGRFPGDGIVGLIERAYPMRLIHVYYELLKGRPLPEIPRRAAGAAAARFLAAPAGKVVAVRGVAAAEAAEGVYHVDVDVAPGQAVTGDLRSSWDRAGDVMVTGATPAEALKRAEAAAALIEIEVRPAAAARVAIG